MLAATIIITIPIIMIMIVATREQHPAAVGGGADFLERLHAFRRHHGRYPGGAFQARAKRDSGQHAGHRLQRTLRRQVYVKMSSHVSPGSILVGKCFCRWLACWFCPFSAKQTNVVRLMHFLSPFAAAAAALVAHSPSPPQPSSCMIARVRGRSSCED